MEIIKPFAVIIHHGKYLVARDRGEDFFKNVGGRLLDDEDEVSCLKRNLQTELGISVSEDVQKIFELPPTPALGDPGHTVTLKGYLIKIDLPENLTPQGDVEELAWVNMENLTTFPVAPQISELILPKLIEHGLL